MKKARILGRVPTSTSGHAHILWDTPDGKIVTSSSDAVPETMAFSANDAGKITDFSELGRIGKLEAHIELIEKLGYKPALR